MVRGLLSSAGTMIYTFILIMIILYVFACMGMELITTDMDSRADPEFDGYVELYFPGIWVTMLTLIQFVMVDSIAEIYTPMVSKNPMLGIYFVLILMVVPISLMNLVTIAVNWATCIGVGGRLGCK